MLRLRFARVLGVALAACAVVASPAAAAPVATSPPELSWWLGEGVPLGASCSAGGWTGVPPLTYRYTWVLDPGPSETVLAAVTTGASNVQRMSTPANVNHRIGCRVEASDDGGATWGGPATAQADPGATLVPPLVRVVVNDGVISGDVGGSLAGSPTVQVRLRRDASDGTPREVDASNIGAIDPTTGTWSVTLPQRAVADDRDTLVVDYTGAPPTDGSTVGSGVPPDTVIPLAMLSGVRVSVSPGGEAMRVDVPACGQAGACPRAVGHGGAAGDVEGISDSPGDPLATSALTMDYSGSPLVNEAAVTAELYGRFWREDGSGLLPVTLAITKAAPMLGVGWDDQDLRDPDVPQDVRVAPSCVVFRSTTVFGGPGVDCWHLGAGALQLVHRRGVTTLQTLDISGDDGVARVALDHMPQTGDTVALRLAGTPSRVLAELTAAALRLDLEAPPQNGGPTGLLGGSCSPGRWLSRGTSMEDRDLLCGAGGAPLGGEVDEGLYRSEFDGDAVVLADDHAGGGTAVSAARVTQTVPADGGATWGATWRAYADTDTMAFPWSGAGAPVIFSYRPRTDPLSTAPFTVVGNANTSTGILTGGLSEGRYEGRWVVTDANGDTRTHTTFFLQQPAAPAVGGPAGPTGATGSAGAAGATGAPGALGPEGPAGLGAASATTKLVLIAYQVTTTPKRVTLRYAITTPSPVLLKVARAGGKAVEVATAKAKVGANAISWNRMLKGARARKGSYALTVTAVEGGQSARSGLTVRLR